LVHRLAPFDEEQVEDYVQKWFAVDRDLPPPQQKQKASTFLQESQAVSDIRSNPLMLALMCNIYRGENYIPKNRPDVYEKCANMLFERWDKSRGILVHLPFEAHINPAMKFLAHWIYADDRLQAGVTEHELVSTSTEYLSKRRFEDADEAAKAARDFIEFCRGRAWVFTDTGTTSSGERLYQFTHRTFLEYFTAAHLIRINPTPQQLIKVLLPRIRKREWDMVAQLAFQLQNKQVEGAGDDLLHEILEHAKNSPTTETWNLLSFAARSLEFLVPSPKSTREIAATCLEFAFKTAAEQIAKHVSVTETVGESTDHVALLGDLMSATGENRGPICDCLEKDITRRIKHGTESEALLAIDAGVNLRMAFHAAPRFGTVSNDAREYWSAVSDRIFAVCTAEILEWSKVDFSVWTQCYVRRAVSIESLFELYGRDFLFVECGHQMFPNIRTSSPADLMLWPALHRPPDGSFFPLYEARRSDLYTVATTLSRTTPPWFARSVRGDVFFRRWSFEDDLQLEEFDLESDALFGAFILVASRYEGLRESKEAQATIQGMRDSDRPLIKPLRLILLAREDGRHTLAAANQIDNLNISEKQKGFIRDWVTKELSFLK